MKNKKTAHDVPFPLTTKLATMQDTAKLWWKARLSVLDPTFGCFYQISRKQRLLVETLHVS